MSNKYIKILLVILVAATFTGCTKLEENLHGQVGSGDVGSDDVPALLNATYIAMRNPYFGPYGWWALQEFPTDEAIVPTRGGDWDDNGAWRALHLHRWESDHTRIHSVFKDVLGVSYAATDILQYNPTPLQEAQARFLRAFAEFSILDGWGQVPYREPGENVTENPKVRNAEEQISYLISEITAVISDLPTTRIDRASPDAAKVLLMKIFLNKGVFLNRASPTFSDEDMREVIRLADEIINSGKYELIDDYFLNFAPDNGQSKTENIFTGENIGGESSATGMTNMWVATLHYNQNPRGNNGFCTLSDFYDKFEESDVRRGGEYPSMTDISGVRVGFLVGQQVNQNGENLTDRRGNLLAFTPEVNIIERDQNHLEVAGIRVIKYPIDYANGSTSLLNNDWVFYRYSDVLLMKAEALLRIGEEGEALQLVNEVRIKRGASNLSELNEQQLLDELGREFFWEGHRRTDLIRFGRFLEAWQEKPISDARNLLFPIPLNQLGNPNYTQNAGY
ncbi:RagB/SusD family nutrient uptake outer membrane protein [Sphingobacterium gobiense]|uniref:RagB/SusD family nutrient uptake outer membrane protein n=1 Tax=Sphingobacterium gobiense TaxID=1382456 RepID=A0A2S9JTJ6_9SPHI|nr:RagB/SusD family nutrient uptake outer membrane protein [Sphingobacterium gobiense]PRD56570.1 RagB/SusD family nutrient uptake outer membrane protein [Sphingobacterium gobiense]